MEQLLVGSGMSGLSTVFDANVVHRNQEMKFCLEDLCTEAQALKTQLSDLRLERDKKKSPHEEGVARVV